MKGSRKNYKGFIMEDFKTFLMQSVKSLDWEDSECCKATSKCIMDKFSEMFSVSSRDVIVVIYENLYAGFDALIDSLKEKGINSINLWIALQEDAKIRFKEKPVVQLFVNLSVLAQEARCYNNVAYKEYKETNVIDQQALYFAVERLVKLRNFTFGLNADVLSIDIKIVEDGERAGRLMFCNSFRQLDFEMYNFEGFHKIFVSFYKSFTKSRVVAKWFGENLITIAEQLSKQLDLNSEYKKQYFDYCEIIKNNMKSA